MDIKSNSTIVLEKNILNTDKEKNFLPNNDPIKIILNDNQYLQKILNNDSIESLIYIVNSLFRYIFQNNIISSNLFQAIFNFLNTENVKKLLKNTTQTCNIYYDFLIIVALFGIKTKKNIFYNKTDISILYDYILNNNYDINLKKDIFKLFTHCYRKINYTELLAYYNKHKKDKLFEHLLISYWNGSINPEFIFLLENKDIYDIIINNYKFTFNNLNFIKYNKIRKNADDNKELITNNLNVIKEYLLKLIKIVDINIYYKKCLESNNIDLINFFDDLIKSS